VLDGQFVRLQVLLLRLVRSYKMYKLINVDGKLACIEKLVDGQSTIMPINPDNTDYQQYLKWVEAGNSPLPADVAASPSTPLPADEGAA